MANTSYVLIEKITVGAAGASSVTFSGIPQTGYTDLVMKYSTRSTYTGGTANTIQIGFNGSTANFTNKFVEGDGASAASGSSARNLGATPSATATANTFSNGEVYIPNYTSANYKSFSLDNVQENNVTTAYADLGAGLWSITSAITSIEVSTNVSTWAQYSTFYLYGVAKLGTTPAIYPKASGGDTIMTDGTYWIHTFISSGTFTPAAALSCDYLVVAGGGGAGGANGGGAGAGGMKTGTTTISAAQTITIGGGGNGSSGSGNGSKGNASSIGSLVATEGGGLGGGYNTAGGNGGSGGGAGGYGTAAGGTATSGEGNNGGQGGNSPNRGGGGGGKGVAGATGNTSGNGGNGSASSISGSSVTYAGGGGGGGSTPGTGGTGGGGAGGSGGAPGGNGTAGTANTGGGGGGGGAGGADGNGGAGGSGIVIVRYAV